MPDSQKLLILARRGIRATRDALAQDNMADLDEIRRQIDEMRAEREAWVARIRQMDAKYEVQEATLARQPTLAEVKELIIQLLTELAAVKTLGLKIAPKSEGR
ncbi:MAG: hypothetical protein AAFV72_18720 [Cyanobacteria bacterium J06635_1]